MDLCWQRLMSLLFNTLPRFAIAFLPRSKCLLNSWVQSPSAVILEPKKINSITVSIVSPSVCYEVMRQDAMIFIFWKLILRQFFHSPLSPSSSGSLLPFYFLDTIRMVSDIVDTSPGNLESRACVLSSPAFHMMHSTYLLNKESGNI